MFKRKVNKCFKSVTFPNDIKLKIMTSRLELWEGNTLLKYENYDLKCTLIEEQIVILLLEAGKLSKSNVLGLLFSGTVFLAIPFILSSNPSAIDFEDSKAMGCHIGFKHLLGKTRFNNEVNYCNSILRYEEDIIKYLSSLDESIINSLDDWTDLFKCAIRSTRGIDNECVCS